MANVPTKLPAGAVKNKHKLAAGQSAKVTAGKGAQSYAKPASKKTER